MPLSKLGIEGLRVLARVEIEPAPGLNLLVGRNAAGKTSVLEAVALLATGRSFRGGRVESALRRGAARLRVWGRVQREAGAAVPLGIEYADGRWRFRVAGAAATGRAALAEQLAVQLIHPDSHDLIAGPPGVRRRFLDWGVFHVEQDYAEPWRRYMRALAQRNAALRSGAAATATAWDAALAAAARRLHERRAAYVEALNAVLPRFTEPLAELGAVSVHYQPGWDADRPLDAVLAETLASDRKRGHTGHGPHRAELVVRVSGRRAAAEVSRGQEKMLAAALLLAQVALLEARRPGHCVLLLDDLAAELDEGNRRRLLDRVDALGVQSFITAVAESPPPRPEPRIERVFHVEQGRLTQVL